MTQADYKPPEGWHIVSGSEVARRQLHASINALTHDEIAEIIRRVHPRAKATRIDELARAAVAQAHRLVSPKK